MRVEGGDGPFGADPRVTGGAGEMKIAEHDAAIARAMKDLYGGETGSRCDPVEEFPGDGDELYGVPKQVREGLRAADVMPAAQRDDHMIDVHGEGAAAPKRHIAASDLSGDGSNDDRFTTHH